MTNGNDICGNCGGDRGIHQYRTDQCPVGGIEAPAGRKQEWKTSTFADIPFDPPSRLVKDMTIREYFAAMIFSGMLANSSPDVVMSVGPKYAVQAADHLIAELNKEQS
jgi:hypothetical protein